MKDNIHLFSWGRQALESEHLLNEIFFKKGVEFYSDKSCNREFKLLQLQGSNYLYIDNLYMFTCLFALFATEM